MTNLLPKGIIKRGDKYRVSTMVRGARKTATCSTLEIAVKTLEQFKLGLLEQAKEQHKTWNLAQAWDAYVDYRLAKTTAKLTVNEKKFKWYGKVLFEFFGPNMSLDDITQQKTMSFYDELTLIRKYSASVTNYFSSLLYGMQLFAFERGRKLTTPHRMKSRKLTKGRVRFLTPEEELQAIEWYTSTGRDAQLDLFCFYVDTGARKSEAFALRFSDINIKTGRITLWETKTNQPRTVKMTARVKRILLPRYAARTADKDRIFSDVAERRFYRDWIEMRDTIGLGDDHQFVIHMLRHTCCTRLLGAGVDIRTVMEWMGHTSIEMTQRYAHFIPQKMDDAASALDSLTPTTVTTNSNVTSLF